WSPDGRRLAVGGQGPAVQVWEVDAGKVVASLTGFKDRVQSLAWAPDGLHIAVGSSKVVQVWNMASGKQAATPPRSGNGEALAWSSDSRRLASGDSAGAVVVWNVEADRNNNQTIKRGGLPIKGVAWSPHGQRLAWCDRSDTIVIWESATWPLSAKMSTLVGQNAVAGGIAWSPDGRRLAVGRENTTVELWDVGTRGMTILRGHTNS